VAPKGSSGRLWQYSTTADGLMQVRLRSLAPRKPGIFQVKTKAESKGPWDLYTLIHTSPPSEVLHPLADSCKFPTT